MKRLAFIVAALMLAAGCATARPAPIASPVEADPWVGFNNGFEKGAENAEAPKPAEGENAAPAAKTEAATAALSNDAADDDGSQAKKAGKKKGKKGRGNAVAGKKPRKRAKRAS